MKISVFVFVLAFMFCQSASAQLSLTKEQIENLDIIHEELRKANANFLGIHGTADDMKVIGMSEEDAKKVIDKINIKTIRQNHPSTVKRNTLRAKFSALGFDEEMLEHIDLKEQVIE